MKQCYKERMSNVKEAERIVEQIIEVIGAMG